MIRQLLVLCMVLLFASIANGQKKNSDVTLFTINDKTIKVSEFVYLYSKNHQGKSEEFTKEKIEEYLELFINFKLKVTEAESRKMDTSEAFVKELNTYKEELKKPFVAEIDVLDKLVKETYERLGQEIKASHILINSKPEDSPEDTLVAFNKAMELRERILKGEQFEKLAREFSDDPSAKSNGGMLGYFSALQMVYPFEQAAYQLKVGEISKPVRTRFGYHLIKVEDKRPSSGEVEVSHILVRGADEQSKKTIDEVYGKLLKEGDWDALCKQYSQDPGTKDNGGRLRPFGPGALASAPKFEEVAFSMNEPGSVSAPFQTSFGWHIIRLENKIKLPPFNEMQESLKRRVARDDRMAISKSIMMDRRKTKLNYKEDPLLITHIASMADSSLIKGKWNSSKTLDGNTKLFSLDGKPYNINDFSDFILRNQSPTNVAPSVYIKQLYDQFTEEKLAEIEDVKLQQENPEYKNLVNEYREGILLFSIMEKEVWNKASEDSIGQRNYYDTHKANYNAGLRVEARIFSIADKEYLNVIKSKIEAGDTLRSEDLSRFKSVTNFRVFERGDNAAIDKINWTVGLHETEADGMYYLVELNKLVEPGLKKFDEVRASIISDYQDYLEKSWIAQLKSKYVVKINSRGKKKAILELTSNEKN